jgi:hypothetical protein
MEADGKDERVERCAGKQRMAKDICEAEALLPLTLEEPMEAGGVFCTLQLTVNKSDPQIYVGCPSFLALIAPENMIMGGARIFFQNLKVETYVIALSR